MEKCGRFYEILAISTYLLKRLKGTLNDCR